MHYYAVIDINVLVSAMLKVQSVPGQVTNEALLGELIPFPVKSFVVTSKEMLDIMHKVS